MILAPWTKRRFTPMALINRQYEDLLRDVLDNGVEKTDRTGEVAV